MAKLSKAKQNDEFMRTMLAKGFETIFIRELPFPDNLRGCQCILAKVANLIHIRTGAKYD